MPANIFSFREVYHRRVSPWVHRQGRKIKTVYQEKVKPFVKKVGSRVLRVLQNIRYEWPVLAKDVLHIGSSFERALRSSANLVQTFVAIGNEAMRQYDTFSEQAIELQQCWERKLDGEDITLREAKHVLALTADLVGVVEHQLIDITKQGNATLQDLTDLQSSMASFVEKLTGEPDGTSSSG